LAEKTESLVGAIESLRRTEEDCYVLVMSFHEGAMVVDARISDVTPPGLRGGQTRVLVEQLVGSPWVKGPIVDFGG